MLPITIIFIRTQQQLILSDAQMRYMILSVLSSNSENRWILGSFILKSNKC